MYEDRYIDFIAIQENISELIPIIKTDRNIEVFKNEVRKIFNKYNFDVYVNYNKNNNTCTIEPVNRFGNDFIKPIRRDDLCE